MGPRAKPDLRVGHLASVTLTRTGCLCKCSVDGVTEAGSFACRISRQHPCYRNFLAPPQLPAPVFLLGASEWGDSEMDLPSNQYLVLINY